MAAGIVGNHGMRHAMMAEFPGGERGTLIARARFVHIDVNGNPGVMRGIDRRSRRAEIDGREPAGVAMSEDVDALARLFRRAIFGSVQVHVADRRVDGDIFIRNFRGAR